MKIWILLILVLLLLVVAQGREFFQPTALIKGPPYSDADYERFLSMIDPPVITAIQTQYKRQNPDKPMPDPSTREGRELIAGGVIAGVMSNFFSQVYEPASQPLTSANVDTFLAGYADPLVTSNRESFKRLLVSYFVTPPPGAQNLPLTAKQIRSAEFAGKSGYADILAGMGQAISAGGAYTAAAMGIPTPGTVTAGTGGGVESGVQAGLPAVSTVSGTTTGGTTTSAYGPTSGGFGSTSGAKGRNVWGPEFPGFGGSGDGSMRASDSTGRRQYPTLLGPKPDTSTLSPAGIIPPSKSWQLANDGSLPGPGVMGSTEDAKYLPYSRTPGDQDLIPDPYRVAAAFSTATYSTKTEPVPFLTDFSAFQ